MTMLSNARRLLTTDEIENVDEIGARRATNAIWGASVLSRQVGAISICWRQIAQITPPRRCYRQPCKRPVVLTEWLAALKEQRSSWDPSVTIVKNTSRVRRSTVDIVRIHRRSLIHCCCCCCCCWTQFVRFSASPLTFNYFLTRTA